MPFSRFVSLPKAMTVVISCLMASAVRAQNGVFGVWTEPGGSSIEVFRCAQDVCLRLVAISPSAPSQQDIQNPNPALRNRSLCGLQIGSGFHTVGGQDHAEGGSLYDPKSGKTYNGSMSRSGEQLRLRGYVGLKIFGVTETWTTSRSQQKTCHVQ